MTDLGFDCGPFMDTMTLYIGIGDEQFVCRSEKVLVFFIKRPCCLLLLVCEKEVGDFSSIS
jgi:hypothetical protein